LRPLTRRVHISGLQNPKTFTNSAVFEYKEIGKSFKEISSEFVGNRRRAYFIDLQESKSGERHIKLTEAGGGRKSVIFIKSTDLPQLLDSVEVAARGEVTGTLVLSGESFEIQKVGQQTHDKSADDDKFAINNFAIKISKERKDGKISMVFLDGEDLKKLLDILAKITTSGKKQ
jgi:hypothetical protein